MAAHPQTSFSSQSEVCHVIYMLVVPALAELETLWVFSNCLINHEFEPGPAPFKASTEY